MKSRHCVIVAVLLAVSLPAIGDDEAAKTIDATDTAAVTAAKDTSAVVQGKVASAEWSKSGKVCTFTFDNAPGFMAVAFEKSKDKLDEAFGGDFVKQMTGAVVKIDGKLAAYGGRDDKFKDAMQIVIRETRQITIVTPTAAEPATQPATQPAG